MLRALFSYGCPEDVAPFITDDKLDFVLSRWLQSWLGGVHIRRALGAHIKVNVLQVVVFLVPPALGAGLSVVALELHVKAVVFGFSVVALVVVLQSIVFLMRRNHQAPRRGTRKSIDDTDTHVNHKIFTSMLLDMLFPPKHLLDEAIGLSLTFCMAGLVMQLLSDRDLGAYASTYSNCDIVENVLGWTVYATAQYPMSARSPVDVNTWRVGAPSALDDVQRAVYVTGLAGLDWILKTAVPSALTARLAVRYCLYATPVLLNFGVLPPTTALFEYIVEQALGVGFGHAPCEDVYLLMMYAVAYAGATGLVAASASAPLAVSLGLASALGRCLASSRLRSWKEVLTREILLKTTSKVVPFSPEHERTMVSEADLKGSMADVPELWRHTLLHSDRMLSALRYALVIALSAGAGAGFASLSDSDRDQCGISLVRSNCLRCALLMRSM
ncbi:hypothetical protein SPRG_16175 [Saprolegnia parasitica CBS 223.65]|uniref:Uncharacterized protein n=1 Tax=Saprolegnia parasitica (strain CBS 223.65) TaxID=695850 RepID=A0A067BJ88_SAPPC|nr:hypothetical protein SPRG_16175 [Saprolegnia parasitica CBS 223.65]KDO18499.1 hypothetical protein SPRG_16175 [Saprolegnia parasitica CBS 223.65]|eukprot:XP_012210794.1 hypothetical protein SPRG_16175 [Saprolegnia parasitica CBS 223.65]